METTLAHLDRHTALGAYVREVDRILESRIPIPEAVARIGNANREILPEDFVLPPEFKVVHPTAAYTRNLVYACPKRKFAVIAILWGPFQETRVHDHLNWCVVKVLEGRAHSTDYERLDDESVPNQADLAIRQSTLVTSGTVTSLLPPPRSNIHKMANAQRKPTITLHTYGDPGTRARVFDPQSGKVEIIDLVFHNVGS